MVRIKTDFQFSIKNFQFNIKKAKGRFYTPFMPSIEN